MVSFSNYEPRKEWATVDGGKRDFYPFARPMAKVHESFEKCLHEEDKHTFGGLYYTENARKLHIAVLKDAKVDFSEKMSAQDVIFIR